MYILKKEKKKHKTVCNSWPLSNFPPVKQSVGRVTMHSFLLVSRFQHTAFQSYLPCFHCHFHNAKLF